MRIPPTHLEAPSLLWVVGGLGLRFGHCLGVFAYLMLDMQRRLSYCFGFQDSWARANEQDASSGRYHDSHGSFPK